ncbi:LLM class flavin-dependent oxidoreductase [Streptomyces sp. SID8382]|nr:LLM class flavin-dependent oxidoreductase [Streptomyces sp. SID8382]
MASASGAVRLPHADPLTYLDVDHFSRLAKAAEDAKIDAVLDHVSKGRAAANIVTTGTTAAAANFGLEDHPSRSARGQVRARRHHHDRRSPISQARGLFRKEYPVGTLRERFGLPWPRHARAAAERPDPRAQRLTEFG